jgi:hypothetical protein
MDNLRKPWDVLLVAPVRSGAHPAGLIALTVKQAAKVARLRLKRPWPDLSILHGMLHGIGLKRSGATLFGTRIEQAGRERLRLGAALPLGRGEGIAVCASLETVLTALAAWVVPLSRRAT